MAHADAAAALIATHPAPLREAAPSDFYWGVGVDGTGCNHLGRLLERVRADLVGEGGGGEGAARGAVREGAANRR
jgi:predicted NAD-dependent protein-ADP-ribosyltransferase YbiA (DUF1768 family)